MNIHAKEKKNIKDNTVSKKEIKKRITNYILLQLDSKEEINDDLFRIFISKAISNDPSSKSLTLEAKKTIANQIFNSMRRLDILQPLMDNPKITEIMVNGPENIFFEENGRLFSSTIKFSDRKTLENVISNYFSRANKPLNESSPLADLRLPDGSRANAVLPPIAPDGPIFTIRKFTGVRPNMDEMIKTKFITSEASDYLKAAVKNKKTIFLCGGTGSGKTTFLNTLSAFIPKDERIITIEDSAELSLQEIPNLVRLESRLKGPEGNCEIGIGKLIRTALRMRPDRIIVGEVRGSEAADMLHALNTGHPGSLCTGHANSCEEMLARLATMVLMGATLPYSAIIRQIALGIDLLVHIKRSNSGGRYVYEIVRLDGYTDEKFNITKIFLFSEENGLVKI